MLLYILLVVEGEKLASPATSSLLPQTNFSTPTPSNVTMTEYNHKEQISDVVKTEVEMPEVSFKELYNLVNKWDGKGVKLERFDHPDDPERVGRVKICMGEAMQNPLFQFDCPTFHAVYKSYRKHSKSLCIILTWALNLHCDLRCLLDGFERDRDSISSYIEAKLAGQGPDPSFLLIGHQLAGETELTYAVVSDRTNKEATFRRPKVDPRKVPEQLKQSITRKPGTLTTTSTDLHGGAYTAKPGINGLVFEKIEFLDVEEPRVFHSAYGAGKGRVALSVLASVWNKSLEPLYAELSQTASKQTIIQPEPEEEAFFALGGEFQSKAVEFPRGRPGGTGGLTPAEHKGVCCGTEPVENVGMVYKDKQDQSYYSVSSEKHKENTCGTEDVEHAGRVYKDLEDGSYFVEPTEKHKENCLQHAGGCPKQHGEVSWQAMLSSGNLGGHPNAVHEPSDAQTNCDTLDGACGIPGEWMAKSTTRKSRRGTGRDTVSWMYASRSGNTAFKFNDGTQNKTWGTFTAAKRLCDDYASSATAKKPKLAQPKLSFPGGGSATEPITLDD